MRAAAVSEIDSIFSFLTRTSEKMGSLADSLGGQLRARHQPDTSEPAVLVIATGRTLTDASKDPVSSGFPVGRVRLLAGLQGVESREPRAELWIAIRQWQQSEFELLHRGFFRRA